MSSIYDPQDIRRAPLRPDLRPLSPLARRRSPSPIPRRYPPFDNYAVSRLPPSYRDQYANNYRPSENAYRPDPIRSTRYYSRSPSPDRRPVASSSRGVHQEPWISNGSISAAPDRRPLTVSPQGTRRDTMLATPMFEPSDSWKQIHVDRPIRAEPPRSAPPLERYRGFSPPPPSRLPRSPPYFGGGDSYRPAYNAREAHASVYTGYDSYKPGQDEPSAVEIYGRAAPPYYGRSSSHYHPRTPNGSISRSISPHSRPLSPLAHGPIHGRTSIPYSDRRYRPRSLSRSVSPRSRALSPIRGRSPDIYPARSPNPYPPRSPNPYPGRTPNPYPSRTPNPPADRHYRPRSVSRSISRSPSPRSRPITSVTRDPIHRRTSDTYRPRSRSPTRSVSRSASPPSWAATPVPTRGRAASSPASNRSPMTSRSLSDERPRKRFKSRSLSRSSIASSRVSSSNPSPPPSFRSSPSLPPTTHTPELQTTNNSHSSPINSTASKTADASGQDQPVAFDVVSNSNPLVISKSPSPPPPPAIVGPMQSPQQIDMNNDPDVTTVTDTAQPENRSSDAMTDTQSSTNPISSLVTSAPPMTMKAEAPVISSPLTLFSELTVPNGLPSTLESSGLSQSDVPPEGSDDPGSSKGLNGHTDVTLAKPPIDISPEDIPKRRDARSIKEALRIVVMTRLLCDRQTREERVDPVLKANLSIVAPDKVASTSPDELIKEVFEGKRLESRTSSFLVAKPSLVERFAERQARQTEKIERLREEYVSLHERWMAHCAVLDEQSKPAVLDLSEILPPSGRTTRRSTATLGDAVRSDLEMEQIIASLGIDELTDPNQLSMKNSALIPDMISVTHGQVDYVFDDTNNLVEDPVEFYGPHTGIHDWNEDEKAIFLEKFAIHPKQFGIIAEYLENKTAAQCVDFYYLHKKKFIDFRKVVQQAPGKRKRRGAGKRKGNALLTDIRQHDAEVHRDSGSNGPVTRRKRGGAPVTVDPRRAPSSRRNTAHLEPTPTSTPTPEPEGRPKRRRGPLPVTRVTNSNNADEENISRNPELEPRQGVKRGRKPRKVVKSSAIVTEDPPVIETRFIDQNEYSSRRKPAAAVVQWSDDDKDLFLRLLAQHGDDFKRIAASMPNKTTIQVSNYYRTNLVEMDLERVAAGAPKRSLTPDPSRVRAPKFPGLGIMSPVSSDWASLPANAISEGERQHYMGPPDRLSVLMPPPALEGPTATSLASLSTHPSSFLPQLSGPSFESIHRPETRYAMQYPPDPLGPHTVSSSQHAVLSKAENPYPVITTSRGPVPSSQS